MTTAEQTETTEATIQAILEAISATLTAGPHAEGPRLDAALARQLGQVSLTPDQLLIIPEALETGCAMGFWQRLEHQEQAYYQLDRDAENPFLDAQAEKYGLAAELETPLLHLAGDEWSAVELAIVPELQALIPELLPAEYNQLIGNLLEHGCLDSLLAFRDSDTGQLTLLDGHNRHAICQKYQIRASVRVLEHITDTDEARAWMLDHQLGRRNLTPENRRYLLGLRYNAEKLGRGGARGVFAPLQPAETLSETYDKPGNTAERIAEQHGASKRTVLNAGKYADGLDRLGEQDPELKQQILTGQTKARAADIEALATVDDEQLPDAVDEIRQGDHKSKVQNLHFDPDGQDEDLEGEPEALPQLVFASEDELMAYAKKLATRKRLDPMLSSGNVEHETPQALFDYLHHRYRFVLDVCATEANAKTARFFTRANDGLTQDWAAVAREAAIELQCAGEDYSIWMNPPYGRNCIEHWVKKACLTALEERIRVVCLVPANTQTRWWWDWCIMGEINFLPGRLTFGEAENSAPFNSAIVIFQPGLWHAGIEHFDWNGSYAKELPTVSRSALRDWVSQGRALQANQMQDAWIARIEEDGPWVRVQPVQ